MSGYFVIAAVSGRYVYNMHSKVYFNKKKAENSLRKMIEHGTLKPSHAIYEITDFKEVVPT